jgi:hypothetical protein
VVVVAQILHQQQLEMALMEALEVVAALLDLQPLVAMGILHLHLHRKEAMAATVPLVHLRLILVLVEEGGLVL